MLPSLTVSFSESCESRGIGEGQVAILAPCHVKGTQAGLPVTSVSFLLVQYGHGGTESLLI